MVQVLDKGFVDIVDFMGGDLRVVNSAKVSFDKASTGVGESEAKLINYLMKHRHGSPFEHTYFTFRVKAPIFVVREWQRHRIGSFNEMSGRYVQFEPEFYVPERWRTPAATNKQGSATPEMSDEIQTWENDNFNSYDDSLIESYAHYQFLIEQGIAKEQARMVLPLSLYTQFYWTVNARSLMNFLNLRTGPDAQWEIRQYAETLEHFFSASMPLTYAAWVENNRLAP
jgi:thymidylate synthase (FAD)